MYDFLIVGAGLFGAVTARKLTDAGKTCLIIDKRSYVGGNCADRHVSDYRENSVPLKGDYYINEHGGHIFHTNSEYIWQFATKYAPFREYCHKLRSRVDTNVYSFPINLLTLYQLWGVTTPQEAREALAIRQVKGLDPSANMETWCRSTIGDELYETFIKGYTTKQWGRTPDTLPASIVRRIPVRLTYDDNYFEAVHQGIPEDGYTNWITTMIEGIEFRLGHDYLKNREALDAKAHHTVYTGPIDAFYDYCYGKLAYRSLRFDLSLSLGDSQRSGDRLGVATMNYPSINVPYTRDVEFMHFYGQQAEASAWIREYPMDEGELYYPIHDRKNKLRYEQYRSIPNSNYTFGGRLGSYRYYDMDQVIGAALKTAQGLL